ncbi:MAG: acetate/propionate family kinase, partial [bacterium]|nr:acetate/propionate family kinase [bacterium]
FHGASHEDVSGRVPEILNTAGRLRLVSCHLGGSSSMCAIDGGRSIDTTMGFSPQSGLENANRHGELDVFAVLYMMERHGWSTGEVRDQLAQTGGLAGLSGIAGGDVRDVEAAARDGNADASLALEVFVYEIRKNLGAYAAAMGGLDAVAFTGGIGENAVGLRASVCASFEFLGLSLDADANTNGTGDRVISSEGSAVRVVVLSTNEELIVARRAFRCLNSSPG